MNIYIYGKADKMNGMINSGSIGEWLKSRKGRDAFICVLSALAIAIVYSVIGRQQPVQEKEAKDEQSMSVNQEQELEERLANVLELVEGAGRVKVFLLFDGSGESVPAYNVQEQSTQNDNGGEGGSVTTSVSQSQNRSVSAGTLIVKELLPEIRGAIVVSQGAGDITVKLRLERAVQTALGISPDKVEIFQMDQNFSGGT